MLRRIIIGEGEMLEGLPRFLRLYQLVIFGKEDAIGWCISSQKRNIKRTTFFLVDRFLSPLLLREQIALRRRETTMLKTKILWFTYGFATASAGITVLVAKRLWAARETHSSQLAKKFGALETRLAYLEKGLPEKS